MTTSSTGRKWILVTGGAGYIGSHVMLSCLLSGEYKVVTIDNLHNSYAEAVKRVTALALAALPPTATKQDKQDMHIELFQGDLTIKEDIEKLFRAYAAKGGIHGTIHVAAHKSVGESGQKPLQYYANNICATVNLLEVMAKFNTTRFVYSSSATVYGCLPVIPIPETTPMSPESCYGRTKFMTELILKDLCDSQPGVWRAIGLRYFNPAGAHPSGLIGEDPVGRPGNLLPLLAQIAVGKIEPQSLKVFGNDYPTPDGTCVRDYIHVMDLAEGHVTALAALENDETFRPHEGVGKSSFGSAGRFYKSFNLGSGQGMSVLNMIDAMRKATGFDFQYEIVGRRLGDVPDLTADPTLAETELNFSAPATLEDMCRDLWNWQCKNPNGYRSI
ncbi:UDP-glucose 4-epimerase [Meredithblackwellia eburnea MCA 4105]